MKFKLLFILSVVLAIACTCMTGNGESSEAVISAAEGWSWEAGATDILNGEINLSGYEQRELTVHMTSNLPYETEEATLSRPVFVTVNGSRITMNKQSDTAVFIPSPEDPFLRFTARFTLPARQRVYSIAMRFTVTDSNGQELKTFSAEINGGEAGTDNVFYIPIDISSITAMIGIAAAVVWIIAVFRFLFLKKDRKQESKSYADL